MLENFVATTPVGMFCILNCFYFGMCFHIENFLSIPELICVVLGRVVS
jgi:hypothetical protein